MSPGVITVERKQAIEALQALQSGEPVYAFRRKGFDDFCTCTEERYLELKEKPNTFEVAIFYTAPQPVTTKPIAAVKGWFHGRCVVQALDPSLVLPAGMALYAAPQPVVPEWIEGAPEVGTYAILHIPLKSFQDHCIIGFLSDDGAVYDMCGDGLGFYKDDIERWTKLIALLSAGKGQQ
jgi:hypothetical protein